MAQLTREEARQIVDEIAQRNGSITDEDRAATPPAVLEALQSVRNQLASKLALWTPLDQPDVRRDVVFRLISSARSLRYTRAEREGKEPYFSLDVSRNRIVIKTNDDGCQESDIEELSEARYGLSYYYTGNLYGAVLSSTARISSEIHVQSGPFSFVLKPQSHGDILGFAIPVNKEPVTLPEGVCSRIVLYPLRSRGFEELVDEFEAIAYNGFVLLDPEDVRQPICKEIVFRTRRDSQTRCLTYKVQLRDGVSEVTKTQEQTGLFSCLQPIVTKRFLLYKPTDPGLFSKTALLFPIDEDSRPVIRFQKVYHIVGSFAFPIGGVGLNVSGSIDATCKLVTNLIVRRLCNLDEVGFSERRRHHQFLL
jgi:hypothetical protein